MTDPATTQHQTITPLSIIKNKYSEGDIVFVKLNSDLHEWPVKIVNFFYQQIRQKVKPLQQSTESYSPGKKKEKRGRPSTKKQPLKYELIYKIKYYQWQSFAFINQNVITPYTAQLQNELKKLNIKKIQKAILKAKADMKMDQRVKLQKQLKKIANKQGQIDNTTKTIKPRTKRCNQNKISDQQQNSQVSSQKSIKGANKNTYEDNLSDYTTSAEKMSKKQQKYNKKLNKSMNIHFQPKFNKKTRNSKSKSKKVLNPVLSPNNSTQTLTLTNIQLNQEKLNEQKIQVEHNNNSFNNSRQTTIIKQQYNQQQNYLEKMPQISQEQNQQNQKQKKVQEVYILDEVLYKNKFHILGILTDLLQDFLTKLIWLDLNAPQSKYVSHQLRNKLNTLNKIIQVQIFTFQQLSRSRSLQKMLNIVKIGQIIDLPNKQMPLPVKKKLMTSYTLLINLLKNLNKSKAINLKNIQKQNRFEVLQFMNFCEQKDKNNGNLQKKTQQSIQTNSKLQNPPSYQEQKQTQRESKPKKYTRNVSKSSQTTRNKKQKQIRNINSIQKTDNQNIKSRLNQSQQYLNKSLQQNKGSRTGKTSKIKISKSKQKKISYEQNPQKQAKFSLELDEKSRLNLLLVPLNERPNNQQ